MKLWPLILLRILIQKGNPFSFRLLALIQKRGQGRFKYREPYLVSFRQRSLILLLKIHCKICSISIPVLFVANSTNALKPVVYKSDWEGRK